MTTNTKIAVPPPTLRTWRSLPEVLAVFSPDEVCLMVHRYCDSQDYAKAYRSRKAATLVAMKAALAEAGITLEDLKPSA